MMIRGILHFPPRTLGGLRFKFNYFSPLLLDYREAELRDMLNTILVQPRALPHRGPGGKYISSRVAKGKINYCVLNNVCLKINYFSLN